jgi:ribosomal protein L7/L12
MRLSRVNAHRNKKKQTSMFSFIINDSHHVLKKLIFTSAITGTALFSTTMAFADGGISEYLKRWYSDRVTEVEEHLTSSLEAEATNQKAVLLKSVREQTELSIKEIQEYAASKQTTIKSNIVNKANETIDAIESDLHADIEKTKKLIDEQATVGTPTTEIQDNDEKTETPPTEENNQPTNDPADGIDDSIPIEKPKPDESIIGPIENPNNKK